MLTPNQQRTVWEGWLGAEIRAYYFADLSGHYQRIQAVVTWLLLASATGAFGALIVDWLPARFAWVRAALSFVTAGLSLWSALAGHQKRATDCADLHFRWNTLATRYAELWDEMYDPKAATTLRQLKGIAAEISKSDAAFPNDAERMGKWQTLVEAQHQTARTA